MCRYYKPPRTMDSQVLPRFHARHVLLSICMTTRHSKFGVRMPQCSQNRLDLIIFSKHAEKLGLWRRLGRHTCSFQGLAIIRREPNLVRNCCNHPAPPEPHRHFNQTLYRSTNPVSPPSLCQIVSLGGQRRLARHRLPRSRLRTPIRRPRERCVCCGTV